MNEQNRKQIIILAVLCLAVVGVLVYQFVLKGTTPVAPKVQQPLSGSPTAAAAARPTAAGAPATKKPDTNPLDPKVLDDLLTQIEQVTFKYPENPERDPMDPLIREGTRLAGSGPIPLGMAGVINVEDKLVSAIVWNDSVQYAIVDDLAVYPGYQYPDGVIVDSIERDKVIFRIDDKRVPVPLRQPAGVSVLP